jgi:hypothetical protein
MFVVKLISRNFRLINGTRSLLSDQNRLLTNCSSILFKNYSPESSPVKIVPKKKRRISSSSEEEEKKETATSSDVVK